MLGLVRQRFSEGIIQILLQIVANDARLNDSHIKPIIQKNYREVLMVQMRNQ